MGDISKGTTFADTGPNAALNASRLNNHVDLAVIQPAFISAKTPATPAAADEMVFVQGGVIKKAAMSVIRPGGWDQVSKLVSDAVISLTGLTDTGILLALLASTVYEIDVMLRISASDSAGVGFGLHYTGGGGSTLCVPNMGTTSAAGAVGIDGAIVLMDTSTGNYLTYASPSGIWQASGWVITGGAPGNLSIQGKKTTSGSLTVAASSFARARAL